MNSAETAVSHARRQRGSLITVYRADQLRQAEVLRCITPILSALLP